MVRRSLLLILGLAAIAWGDTGQTSTVKLLDPNTPVSCVAGQINVSPGTLSCAGQVATLTTGGGGGSGGSSSLEVMVNSVRITSPTATVNEVAGTGIKITGLLTGGATSQVTTSLSQNIAQSETITGSSLTVTGPGGITNTYGVVSGTFNATNANSPNVGYSVRGVTFLSDNADTLSESTLVGNTGSTHYTTGATCVGYNACNALTGSGQRTVMVGFGAGSAITSGSDNTCEGYNACSTMQTSTANSCFGSQACQNVNSGTENTAMGYISGHNITTGGANSCFGYNSCDLVTTGSYDTLLGASAGADITTGLANTCVGGNGNGGGAAYGAQSCSGIVQGSSNTAIGNSSLGYTSQSSSNSADTMIGYAAQAQGTSPINYSTCIGYECVVTSSNTAVIGAPGTAGEGLSIYASNTQPYELTLGTSTAVNHLTVSTAGVVNISALGTNTNICTDGSHNITTSGCNNGTLTSAYTTIDNAGSGLTQRATLNFTGTGVTCSDNSGSSRTDCTITAGGGSGASTLGAGLSNGTNLTVLTSSPTALWAANNSQFNASQLGGATYYLTLNPSSVTLQGNTFNGASQLVQDNSSGYVPNANLDPSSVTKQGYITAASLGALTANQNITLTGDVTGGPAATSIATTLAAQQSHLITSISSFTVANKAGITTTGPIVASSGTLGSAGAAVYISSNLVSGATIYADGRLVALNFSGSSSGSNTGDQTITLTGDVTGSGTGSFAATAAANQPNIVTLSHSSVTVSGALSIPNGILPTANAPGEIGIGTAAGQLWMHDGTNTQVVASSTHSFTVTVSSGVGWNSLSLPVWRAPIASSVTITEVLAESLPANTTVQYQLSISTFGQVNFGSAQNVFSVLYSSAADGGYDTHLSVIVKPKYSVTMTTPSANAGAGNPAAMTFTVYYLENKQ